MRPILRWWVLSLAVLALSGCTGKVWRKVPESMTAKAPAAPETEVKPVPVVEPPSAVPPPMAASPVASAGGKAQPGSPAEQTKEALEAKPTQTAVLPPVTSEAAVSPCPVPKVSKPAPEATVAARTPAPSVRSVPASAAKERSIAVVGDSLAVGIGMTMEKHLKHAAGVGCVPLGKVSTGLVSKRSFDWDKRLSDLVATEKPTAVVVMMGGNDANNAIAGKAAGSPEWGAAYRGKVEHFLRIAATAGVRILWVGLPAMRDPAYAARVRAVNAAAREACAAVPGCIYMESGDLFVDGAGRYVQAKDIGGRTVPLRAKDGVHMTMIGYDLLCRQVLERLAALGALPQ